MTSEQDATDATAPLGLAQSLCARLCHDLGGPAGTIAAMLDMATEEGGSDAEALSVATDGARLLRARVRVWRAACGGDTGPMTVETLTGLLAAMLAGGRVHFACALPPETSLPPSAVQLALVAALVAIEALPRGGTVHLAGDPAALMVLPAGPESRWPPALSAALAGRPADPDPRHVLPPFLAALAVAEGWRLGIGLGAGPLPGPLTLTRV